MKQHIGIKLVNAVPMTRQAYNDFRGWKLPDNENGADEGYLVEYVDGGAANTEQYQGYVSWSPKDVFDRAYRSIADMTFGMAVEALRMGKRVQRAGWNGKGMWLVMVNAKDYDVAISRVGTDSMRWLLPWIAMKTADNGFVPWLASQTDMLAEDWRIVE